MTIYSLDVLFLIWNQSVVPCPVLTVASWPAYKFFKRQVRWSGIPISWRISTVCCDPHSQRFWHSQKSSSWCFCGTLLLFPSSTRYWQFDLWFLCLFYIHLEHTFIVHILLKSRLENFEHHFTSMWDECNCVEVWALFDIAFLWDWNENWPFLVLWPILILLFTSY